MRTVTTEEMRDIDRKAVEEYGIPALLLMENAGIACAFEVLNLKKSKFRQVAVFAGKGNNGGDGLVAARHLSNNGVNPVVFYFQSPANMKPDPLVNLRILEKMKVGLVDCSQKVEWNRIKEILKQSDAVVDALFGTGLSKPVGDPFKTVIDMINSAKTPVISVDVPSGLNADTGEVMGVCVQAHTTVALALPKKGFFKGNARQLTGRVIVADISIPRELLV